MIPQGNNIEDIKKRERIIRDFYREWKEKGDAMWQKFNQKDVNEQAWYYTSIANLTKRLSSYSAWIEYKTLTEIVFKKGV